MSNTTKGVHDLMYSFHGVLPYFNESCVNQYEVLVRGIEDKFSTLNLVEKGELTTKDLKYYD